MTKSSKEADAIKKLDNSALLAQERITQAAEKAQKMIDDACATATQALETSSRIPDKRNLDGSFQWDRGDRYRRGSDDRLERLEDKVISINGARGDLQVGQAKREEQIIGLLEDVTGIKKDYDQIRNELDTVNKEVTSRMSTLRELILEVKDTLSQELSAMRTEFIKQQAESQSNIQWKIIAALSSLAFLFILVFISYSFHVFGGLP
jgi:chromosome segregation ATPase